MSKRAKMDTSAIVMDEIDGMSAKELFGQGAKSSDGDSVLWNKKTWAPPPFKKLLAKKHLLCWAYTLTPLSPLSPLSS